MGLTQDISDAVLVNQGAISGIFGKVSAGDASYPPSRPAGCVACAAAGILVRGGVERGTIELAQAARANDLDAISLRQKQEMEKASQEKTEKAKAAMRAAGEYRAQGRIGNSSTALLADVQRQLATFDYYTDRNTAFAGQLFDKKRKDADITMANRISSETPYLKRTILDPMAPGKRAAPGKEAMYLQMGSAVMGGVTTGLGIDQSLKGMKAFGYG